MATNPQRELAANIAKEIVVANIDNIGSDALRKNKEINEAVAEAYVIIFDASLKKIIGE
jgi:hypothetical protein